MPDADLTRQRRVVDAYLAASRGWDFDALGALLHPDAVLRADRAVGHTPTPVLIRGAHAVAKGAFAASERARFKAGPSYSVLATTETALGTVTICVGHRDHLPPSVSGLFSATRQSQKKDAVG